MFLEEQLLPISALQHYLYCRRQCALIHLEQEWQENRFTAEGQILHQRVHLAGDRNRPGLRIRYAQALRSLEWGLYGVADVVEYHLQADGLWQALPVEYKRGLPKQAPWDRVQLCAQALCLEEMNQRPIAMGALYYGQQRRRQEVSFDDDLRTLTKETATGLHALLSQAMTPPPRYDAKRCRGCSLFKLCLPCTIGRENSVTNYYHCQLAIKDDSLQ
ncbi:MAG: CRISPR-associated protein Cas4 [Magnetococcales bacterium]|nr:CRISPR-associated protein Cas4 [Magnetococcales bacterium]